MNTLIAALSISGLLPLLIEVIIVAVVCWLIWWLIGYIGLPQPFDRVLRIIVAIVAVVYLVNLLLGLGGHAFITR